MKKIVLLISFIGLMHAIVHAQSCFPQGITFTTQQQIDNYHLNYPDCTRIEGDVKILGPTITNLDSLIVLDSIDGDLSIESNPNLTSLGGLLNLAFVGGDLRIGFNNLLASLSGLNNVSTVGGYLHISYLNELVNFSGLDGLTYVGDGMMINANDTLESIAALSNLTSISNELQIFDNAVLTNLSGLENVDAGSVDFLRIYGNPSLSDCQVQSICDYLASPAGEIDIFSNAEGCNNPPEVSAGCGIAQVCLPYGNYYFLDQADIDEFQSDYPGCTQLGGSVQIQGNDIQDLSGLNSITSVGKDLKITHNPNLHHLSGLENLVSAGRTVQIQYNESLTGLSGLEALTTIGGILSIAYNDSLLSLNGLQALTSVGSDLGISHNDQLANLNGLNNLASVGRNLAITSNPSLKNVTALDAVEEIYGTLSIGSNDSLYSLVGLDNIDYMTILQLSILSNNILSECEVKSVCDYLDIIGWADIFDNADGCDNSEEVKEACKAMPVNDPGPEMVISAFPVPASTYIVIDIPMEKACYDEALSICDLHGRQVLACRITGPHMILDISGLPEGIYLARTVTEGTVMVGKFVKQ